MRIQHNIMAMNAYRNYNNNTSALSKNLEKLSSGYKINRAGDDAAGLAISEKMRAQITGLNAATKNVKDGVSLVKTAEGAMQEIQDMLNRMDYLATQSANGTYDNEVDRANLQKEVDALKTEINRIADSANFNGIKLLDGSLDADGVKSVVSGIDLLPKEVGQVLGENTVLHKDDNEGADATSFAVDLHNVKFTNKADEAITIKIGDNAYTYTAGDDANYAIGTAMDAKDIAAAFAAGKFKLGTEAMTAGEAKFGDAEFKVEADTTVNGRINFTQTNNKPVNPKMEVTIYKGANTTADVLQTGRSGRAGEGENESAIAGEGKTDISVGGTPATYTPETNQVTGVTVNVTAADAGAGDVKVKIDKLSAADATAAGSGKLANLTFTDGATSASDANGIKINIVASGKATATEASKATWDKDTKTVTVSLASDFGTGTNAVQASDIQGLIQALGDKSGDTNGGINFSSFTVSGTGTIAQTDLATAGDIGNVTLDGGAAANDMKVTLTSAAGAYTKTVKAADWKDTVTITGDKGVSAEITASSVTANVTETKVGAVTAAVTGKTATAAGLTKDAIKTVADGVDGIASGKVQIVKNADDTLSLKIGDKTIGTSTEKVNGTATEFNFKGADADTTALGKVTFGAAPAVADFKADTVLDTGLTYTAAGSGDPEPPEGTEPVETEPVENAGVGDVTIVKPEGSDAPPAGDVKMEVVTVTEATPATGSMDIGEGTNAKTISINTKVDGTALNGMEIKFVVGANASAAYSDGTLTVTLSKTGGTSSDGKYTQADLETLLQGATGMPNGVDLSNLTVEAVAKSRAAGDVVLDVSGNTAGDEIGTLTVSGGAAANDKQVNITIGNGGQTVSQVISAADWADSKANGTDLNISAGGVSFTMNVKDMVADGWNETDPVTIAKIPGDEPESSSSVTGDYNKSTTVINEKQDGGGDRLASTAFNLTKDMVVNGASISIAGEKYEFTTDAKAAAADSKKVFIGEKGDADLSLVAERLTLAAKDNKVYTVGHDGSRITVTETVAHAALEPAGVNTNYPADKWDLSTLKGIEDSLQFATAAGEGKPLTLQIGDTSDSFNQMKVSVGDMHTTAMGTEGGKSIADIDISTQAGAQEAVTVIKNAINYVSGIRGDLGAIQNRLEHTQNNLSVMAENIQDAESTIRDTDVAEEMMSYVKNNILVQSAQAMLAQANQVPQGVLQLLG